MKYIYCEYPTFGNPIEIEMSKEDAIKRYDAKIKALNKRNDIISKAWFVGVQKRNNQEKEWIKINDEL